MAVPLNPHIWQVQSSIQTLEDARRYIDGFERPSGFNNHAWSTTKRLALLVWRCHFEGRAYNRTLNFLHPTFYEMIRTPEGNSLIREQAIRRLN
jgi:hypothetical protein